MVLMVSELVSVFSVFYSNQKSYGILRLM